jgi:hypothetical protein
MLALADYPHIATLRDRAQDARAKGDFGRAKALEKQVAKARTQSLRAEMSRRSRTRRAA